MCLCYFNVFRKMSTDCPKTLCRLYQWLAGQRVKEDLQMFLEWTGCFKKMWLMSKSVVESDSLGSINLITT